MLCYMLFCLTIAILVQNFICVVLKWHRMPLINCNMVCTNFQNITLVTNVVFFQYFFLDLGVC